MGRFLSVDPVSASSINGGNFNRYWYANNNPYKFTDPDGRLACSGAVPKSECIRPANPWKGGAPDVQLSEGEGSSGAGGEEEAESAAETTRGYITGAAGLAGVAQAVGEPNTYKGKEWQTWLEHKSAPIKKWGGDLASRAERANFRRLRIASNTLGAIGLGYAGFDFNAAYEAGDTGGMALALGDGAMGVIGLTPAGPGTFFYEPVKAWGDHTESGAWVRSKVVDGFCYVGGGC